MNPYLGKSLQEDGAGVREDFQRSAPRVATVVDFCASLHVPVSDASLVVPEGFRSSVSRYAPVLLAKPGRLLNVYLPDLDDWSTEVE